MYLRLISNCSMKYPGPCFGSGCWVNNLGKKILLSFKYLWNHTRAETDNTTFIRCKRMWQRQKIDRERTSKRVVLAFLTAGRTCGVQTLPTTPLYSGHVGAGRSLARSVSQTPGHENWKAPSPNADGSFYSQQEGKEGNEIATLHWSPLPPLLQVGRTCLTHRCHCWLSLSVLIRLAHSLGVRTFPPLHPRTVTWCYHFHCWKPNLLVAYLNQFFQLLKSDILINNGVVKMKNIYVYFNPIWKPLWKNKNSLDF